MTRRTLLAHTTLAWAESHIGDPYSLGGIGQVVNGRPVWDCRGFVCGGLHQVRLLPANAWPLSEMLYERYQAHALTVIAALQLPGALLFWQRADGSILHVAYSRGDGTVIHAAGTPGIDGEPQVCVAAWDAYPAKPTRAVDPFA